MFFSDLRADGSLFLSDPLGRGTYHGERVPVRVLEAFALSPIFGTTAKVTAAFSIVGTRPSAPVVPDTATSSTEEDMPNWVTELAPITPSRAAIRPGAKLHRSPDASSPAAITIGAAGYTATVVAAVGTWLVYLTYEGGPIFVARADVTSLTPLAANAEDVAALVKAGRKAGAQGAADAAAAYARAQ